MTDHTDGFNQVKCLMLILPCKQPLYFFLYFLVWLALLKEHSLPQV